MQDVANHLDLGCGSICLCRTSNARWRENGSKCWRSLRGLPPTWHKSDEARVRVGSWHRDESTPGRDRSMNEDETAVVFLHRSLQIFLPNGVGKNFTRSVFEPDQIISTPTVPDGEQRQKSVQSRCPCRFGYSWAKATSSLSRHQEIAGLRFGKESSWVGQADVGVVLAPAWVDLRSPKHQHS